MLREEGIKKCRLLEEKKFAETTSANTSIYDLPLSEPLNFETRPQFTARLKYKHRHEVNIDESILAEIMSIFGEVKRVELLGTDDRYAYARIHFDDINALNAATEYNYSTAQKWDGTDVRKLASLLRSCKKDFGPEGGKWTNNPVVNAVLDKYVQSISDKKEVAVWIPGFVF